MENNLYNRFFRFRKSYLFLIIVLIFLGGMIAAYFEGQLFLIFYKLCLCLLAGIIASNLDYALFPFAKPESYLEGKWYEDLEEGREDEADVPIVPGQELAFFVACLRKALIICVCIIGVCIAL